MNTQQIEELIKSYEGLKARKNILKAELDCIEETGVSAIDYSAEKIGETYKISKITEIAAIKNIKMAKEYEMIRDEIKTEIKLIESRLIIIDNLFKILEEDESKIIYKFYIENKTFDMIKREMYLSHRQIRYRKQSALNKMQKEIQRLEKCKVNVR